MRKRSKYLWLTGVLACGLSACAGSKQELKDLRQENEALRKQQLTLNEKVDSLSSSLSVLQDRLETMNLSLEREMRKPAARSVAKAQPQGLRKSLPRMADDREPFLIEEPASVQNLPTLSLSNQDLDRADRSIQDAPAPSTSATLPHVQEDGDVRATETYNRAYAQFEAKNYSEAFKALNQFVAEFKDHPYADNAVFWIGEGYFQQRQYAQAVKQFERVVQSFPQGNKVPDALLRAGSCYLRLSKPEAAQTSFRRLIELYPQSIAAKKAQTWLAEISRNPSKGRM